MSLLSILLFSLLAAPLGVAAPKETSRDETAIDESIGLEIRQLITKLDADTFQARDESMQAIAMHGAKAVPFLVESLNHPSAELRMRVMLLLAEHGSFEHVATLLLKAIDRPGGTFARTVLQGRCLQQIDVTAEIANCDRLFKFWGTTREKYRYESLIAFQNAKTTPELAVVVEPLLHMRDKVKHFDEVIARLGKLSVASDHRHSPGYIVAETLAQGLRSGRADCVTFGTRYVEALEMLAAELTEKKYTPNAIRQEIANRASWSQGATNFLVQLLDPDSQPSKALADSIHIPPHELQESFLRGLRTADTASFARGVGRVHIVDLLNETIRSWPTIPNQGTAAELVSCIVEAAHEGDKPHALVYLEALEACRKLHQRGLDLSEPPVKLLADRLLATARAARNHRDYFPAQTVHSKLVGILERGMSFDHDAFPREYFDQFVQGAAEATSEDQRRLFEKYVSILDRLMKAGINFEQPSARQVMRALRKHLANSSDQLSVISRRLADLPTTESWPADRVVEWLATELNLE